MINCGDDVIINGTKNECLVGHIDKLYELEGTVDPNRAIIQWYFSYDELLKLSKHIITVDIEEPWRELFLSSSEDVRNHCVMDIDAETISRKCTVLRLEPHDIPPDCLHRTSQEDLFYVRYRFDRYYNLHPVNIKMVTRESVSKSASTNHVKTPNCTPRRASTRKQNLVKENCLTNTAKTPKARIIPAKGMGKLQVYIFLAIILE